VTFQRVARRAEVPVDRGLAVRVGDIAVALFLAEDRIHAMEDRCAHADFPLSQGTLAGCVVTCSAHGWPFDVRTGFHPDHPDGFPIPCFAVREEGEEIWVDVEDVVNRRRPRRR
jgi:3-phenylpropionate/trans-cinnamate dioxygenase ferredoxin subunit